MKRLLFSSFLLLQFSQTAWAAKCGLTGFEALLESHPRIAELAKEVAPIAGQYSIRQGERLIQFQVGKAQIRGKLVDPGKVNPSWESLPDTISIFTEDGALLANFPVQRVSKMELSQAQATYVLKANAVLTPGVVANRIIQVLDLSTGKVEAGGYYRSHDETNRYLVSARHETKVLEINEERVLLVRAANRSVLEKGKEKTSLAVSGTKELSKPEPEITDLASKPARKSRVRLEAKHLDPKNDPFAQWPIEKGSYLQRILLAREQVAHLNEIQKRLIRTVLAYRSELRRSRSEDAERFSRDLGDMENYFDRRGQDFSAFVEFNDLAWTSFRKFAGEISQIGWNNALDIVRKLESLGLENDLLHDLVQDHTTLSIDIHRTYPNLSATADHALLTETLRSFAERLAPAESVNVLEDLLRVRVGLARRGQVLTRADLDSQDSLDLSVYLRNYSLSSIRAKIYAKQDIDLFAMVEAVAAQHPLFFLGQSKNPILSEALHYRLQQQVRSGLEQAIVVDLLTRALLPQREDLLRWPNVTVFKRTITSALETPGQDSRERFQRHLSEFVNSAARLAKQNLTQLQQIDPQLTDGLIALKLSQTLRALLPEEVGLPKSARLRREWNPDIAHRLSELPVENRHHAETLLMYHAVARLYGHHPVLSRTLANIAPELLIIEKLIDPGYAYSSLVSVFAYKSQEANYLKIKAMLEAAEKSQTALLKNEEEIKKIIRDKVASVSQPEVEALLAHQFVELVEELRSDKRGRKGTIVDLNFLEKRYGEKADPIREWALHAVESVFGSPSEALANVLVSYVIGKLGLQADRVLLVPYSSRFSGIAFSQNYLRNLDVTSALIQNAVGRFLKMEPLLEEVELGFKPRSRMLSPLAIFYPREANLEALRLSYSQIFPEQPFPARLAPSSSLRGVQLSGAMLAELSKFVHSLFVLGQHPTKRYHLPRWKLNQLLC